MGSQGRDAPSRLVFLPLLQPSHSTPKQLALSTTYLELREADDLEGHFPGVGPFSNTLPIIRPSYYFVPADIELPNSRR
ncbi:hypothetical protein VTI28DRAFT_1767 [Corynascus sepedonium]